MKTRVFPLVLIWFCLAPSAQGQEILSTRDARYRLSGVNGTYIARPDGSTAPGSPETLTLDHSLARCDELVAAIIERAAPTGGKGAFVRERTVPLRDGRTWVEYSQRHQGFRIVGAGARIELDARGRIDFAGLQYESEKLASFKPRDAAVLGRKARWAVPRPIAGPPSQAELMIDPMGEAPARLLYHVVFPVRELGREGGWQVSVDAVSGKVVSSRSTTRYAAAATH